MKKLLFVLLASLLLIHVNAVNAQEDATMRSTQYRVKFGNLNSASGTPSSTNYDLGTTLGQLAANEFSSSGYTVKAGFQYIHSIIPFTFSISDTSIEFGTLTAQTPTTQTVDLTVSFGAAGEYVVTATEIGPLDTAGGSESIPDTVCNGGAQTCTETSANVWDSTSAYGFGYNMSGDGAPADFINGTYFRPFPDSDQAENPATVMTSSNVTTSDTATVTFKTNISAVQAAGSYSTVIKFVATPSY